MDFRGLDFSPGMNNLSNLLAQGYQQTLAERNRQEEMAMNAAAVQRHLQQQSFENQIKTQAADYQYPGQTILPMEGEPALDILGNPAGYMNDALNGSYQQRRALPPPKQQFVQPTPGGGFKVDTSQADVPSAPADGLPQDLPDSNRLPASTGKQKTQQAPAAPAAPTGPVDRYAGWSPEDKAADLSRRAQAMGAEYKDGHLVFKGRAGADALHLLEHIVSSGSAAMVAGANAATAKAMYIPNYNPHTGRAGSTPRDNSVQLRINGLNAIQNSLKAKIAAAQKMLPKYGAAQDPETFARVSTEVQGYQQQLTDVENQMQQVVNGVGQPKSAAPKAATPMAPAAPAAAPATSQYVPGQIYKGHRFKGGNPALPENWEKN